MMYVYGAWAMYQTTLKVAKKQEEKWGKFLSSSDKSIFQMDCWDPVIAILGCCQLDYTWN